MNEVVVADRSKYMGGSDIAALLGIAPPFWKRNSPVALYYDKITPRAPETPLKKGDVRRRGKRWEGVVGEMLVEQLEEHGHKVEILGTNQYFTDPTYPFFKAEIDFEVRLDGDPEPWNVELKTVHPFKAHEWGESETDQAPDWYLAQLLWGLGVSGRRHGIIAPLFGADTLRIFPIPEPDAEIIAQVRAKALEFWTKHVLARVPPTPMFLADLGLLYPAEGDDPQPLVADEALTDVLLRLRAINREITARQAEYDALEFQVKRAMGERREIVVADKSAVTWKLEKRSALDQGALKESYPKIHRELMRTFPARVFRLKPFAWNGGDEA